MNTKVTVKRRVALGLLWVLSIVFAGQILFGSVLRVWALVAMTPVLRVSETADGVEQDAVSWGGSAVSEDGLYVAFVTYSSNLIPVDANGGDSDILLKNTQTGEVTLISKATNGDQANNYSDSPSISADGRYVAFASPATNLVPGDVLTDYKIFVHDTQTGTTSIATSNFDGDILGGYPEYGNSNYMSADGRYISFHSGDTNLVTGDTNGVWDVFVKDMQAGTLVRASTDSAGIEGNAGSSEPAISADGRHVAFVSYATNLVTGDTNADGDIFVKDLQTGQTIRVSTSTGGGQVSGHNFYWPPTISADGRYVVFDSDSTSLVANDTNALEDFFIKDTQTDITRRVTTSSAGVEANDDSQVDDASLEVSADGRFVLFASYASNLVPGDTNAGQDVFLKDMATGDVSRISTSSLGVEGDSGGFTSDSMSADGRYITFMSDSTNLVEGETNGTISIFMRANPFALFLQDEDLSDTTLAAGSTSGSVLSAATKNGSPIDPTDYVLSISDDGGLTGVTINADGTLTIPAGAASGIYTITYQACEAAAPAYCWTATAVLGVSAVSLADTGAKVATALTAPAVVVMALAIKVALARRRYEYGRRLR